MSDLILITERLKLRRWQQADLVPFRRINADPLVMEFMPKVLIQEESDAIVHRIEKHFIMYGFGLMAAELKQTGEFVGFVGLSVPGFEAEFMPAVEIGWRLAKEHWGKGLATEAAREVLNYAFLHVGFEDVVSFTVPTNVRSLRVMEKLGMSLAAEFDHPLIPSGNSLRRHLLYRLNRVDWNR